MSPASASADKTERLLNLILALKSARRPVSKQKIRESLPAYAAATSDEAFDRMFERDKDELREMGIPISTTVLDVLFDDEVGYRIDSSETTLPGIALRARRGRGPRAGGPGLVDGEHLRRRLGGRCASCGSRASRSTSRVAAGAEPRIRTKEPAFEAVHAAVIGPAADHLRLPQERRGADDAPRAAVGAEELARPLVPHGFRRRPRRRARVPAQPLRGRRSVARAGRGRMPSRPTTCPRWPSRRSCPSPEGTAVVRVRHGRGHTLRRPPSAPARSTSSGPRSSCPTAGARPSATSPPWARTPSPCRRPSSSRPSARRCGQWPGHTTRQHGQAQPPCTRRHDRRHRHERFEAAGSTSTGRDGDAAPAGGCSTWCRGCSSTAACRSPRPRASSASRGAGRRGPRAAVRLRHARATATPSSSTPVGSGAHLPRQRRRHRRVHASDP